MPRQRVFQLGFAMTLPEHIAVAAQEGDLETVKAYFEDDTDGARDVDDIYHITYGVVFTDVTGDDLTALLMCSGGRMTHLTLRNVEMARYLLSRGASVDKRTSDNGHTPLLLTCYCDGGTVAEMISLLLSAGANPNARNDHGRTPLGAHIAFCRPPSVECVTALLRGGASLDRVYGNEPFENYLRGSDVEEGTWTALRALAAGVRRAGSFKSYCREPHRELLLLRGLAMRGHLAPKGTRRTRGAQKWKAAAAFLARLGDNGVVWNVLSFWRAAN